MDKFDRLSVFISLVLRHQPDAAGITLSGSFTVLDTTLFLCYDIWIIEFIFAFNFY